MHAKPDVDRQSSLQGCYYPTSSQCRQGGVGNRGPSNRRWLLVLAVPPLPVPPLPVPPLLHISSLPCHTYKMKNALLFAASAAVAAAQHGYHGSSPRRGPPSYRKPLVDSTSLQKEINIEDLMKGSQKLQDIADANDGTRVFGSSGSNATIDWLFEELTSLGTYDVYKHYFIELFSDSSATLAVEGSETDFVPLPMSYTTPTDGVVVADFIQIAELGCETSDFPAGTEGSIALISRGTCTFATKAENAYLAGAVGAVIYNNLEGSLSGTLGGVGEYAPVVGVTQEEGQAIAAMLENGPVSGELEVQSLIENRTTANIIAQTKGGDQDNVLVSIQCAVNVRRNSQARS